MKYPLYKYFYALADFITLGLAFFVSHEIYSLFFTRLKTLSFDFGYEDYLMVLGVNILFIFIFHYFHLYKLNVFLTRAKQTVVIIKSLIYGIFIIVLFSFFLKFPLLTDSRLTIVIFLIVAFVFLVFVRVILFYYLYINVLSKKIFKRKILIMGAGKSGQFFAQKLSFENLYGYEIVGFADDVFEVGTKVFKGLKVLGNTNELQGLHDELKFDEIVICIDKIEYDRLMVLIDKCKNLDVSVKVTSDLFGIIPERIFSEHYENIPVLDVSTKVNLKAYKGVKRVIDYIGAGIGIIILSPFFIVVSLIIKMSSKGPVIHKQVRIGKDGKPFNFYKFRSMRMIQGEDKERKQKMIEFMKNGNGKGNAKIVNDSRVTWIGGYFKKIQSR